MAVDIDDGRVASAAARLHAGGWWFSARQLYYAVCADVELAPVRVAPAELGLGLVMILAALIVEQRAVLVVVGGLGAVLVVAGALTHLQERRPRPLTRSLSISFDAFETRFLRPGTSFPGLVTTAPAQVAPAPGAAVVVCDRPETAAVVLANASRFGDPEVVTGLHAPGGLVGREVVALHDCDPAGCALVAELRDLGVEVADVGINPGEVIDRRLQVLEGAPARLPRDLSVHLDTAQTDWLRSGRRLECATETPEQLATRVRSAV